jgi:hypothetical protein
MKSIVLFYGLILTFSSTILAQKIDTIIQYSEKTPAQWAGKSKKWKEEKVYFSEFTEGTGEGIFKKPNEDWATHTGFRSVTVRIVGKDSLLLKFRTRENWNPASIRLGKCNASPHSGVIVSVNKKAGPFFDEAVTIPEQGWHWEIIVAWPWDTAFRDRVKPFGFFISFVRADE